jgi:hypothetical protein
MGGHVRSATPIPLVFSLLAHVLNGVAATVFLITIGEGFPLYAGQWFS